MDAVRFATPADADALRALIAGTSTYFDVGAELARSYAKLWVIGAEGADLDGALLSWEVADEVHLLDVLVAPAARRRGLGRALLSALLARARERAARVVLLEVRRDNLPAQRLYESAGFTPTGERRSYYADGEDALLFSLSLTEEP